MKTLKNTWPLLILLLPVLGAGCSKSNAARASNWGTVTFTINGDGYVNKTITLTSVKDVPGSGAVYFPKWGFTQVKVSDRKTGTDPDTNDFYLYFDGTGDPANQHFGDPFKNQNGPQTLANLGLDLTTGNVQNSYGMDFQYPANTKGSITVNDYKAVGDTIMVSFAGVLVNQDTGIKVVLNNGSLKVIRNPDNQ